MSSAKINNRIYNELGDKWYHAKDHPVALLRAESRLRNPWIEEIIKREFKSKKIRVLDLGCGGGFLSNYLAEKGIEVTGIDRHEGALEVARKYDSTKKVKYVHSEGDELAFPIQSFDVVCALDFLEHVDDPQKYIKEALRVLRSGGLFIFYTFNRNFFSWLVVVKFVEWFFKNAPSRLHVKEQFIKPDEMRDMLLNAGAAIEYIKGVSPDFFSNAFWKSIFRGEVLDDFSFKFTKSGRIAYMGYARRKEILLA